VQIGTDALSLGEKYEKFMTPLHIHACKVYMYTYTYTQTHRFLNW
jgi:hypothetical protein